MSRPGRVALALTALAALALAGPVGAATGQEQPSPGPTVGQQQARAANQPPVATPDEATVTAGQAVTVPVLANDTDDGLGRPEGEPPRLEVVAADGAGGRASHTESDVTVVTHADDRGDLVVGYTVSDGEATSAGQVTVHVGDPATRSVTLDLGQRPVALRRHTVTGQVQPAAGGIVVRVQRHTKGGWSTVSRTRTDPSGGYAAPFRTARPGRHTLRAVAVFRDGSRARSDRLRLRVRARADARVSGPLDSGDVPHSWRPGCPVPPSQLRRIRVNHWAYGGTLRRGTIVVRATEARAVVRVVEAAFDSRFPIRRIKPADHYYAGGRRTPMGSDKAAMRAGNTSAFNCRPVTGNPYRISQHSYGNAIDINTIENPYVTRGAVYPAGSRRYLDRSPYRRGMIVGGGVIATKMRRMGWAWGARWGHPDYQHFSSNGG